MKKYIIVTTEEQRVSYSYIVEANSKEEAEDLFLQGEGEEIDNEFIETTWREIDYINEVEE